jgi:hypothetical protein
MKKFILLAVIFLGCKIQAQDKKIFQDVKSLVNETQKVISVKKGEKIDTTYFRTLFLPTANFTVVGEENGKKLHETMGLSEFIKTLTDEYYSNGYFETGKGHIIEQYEGIAQVIQSFYGKDSEGEEAWGVNSYQFIYSQGRWWIANMIWTISEDGEKGIPEKYLKN